MALQAKLVHIVASKEARIWRTVREVAKCASLRFDRRVLIHKRTGLLSVAFHAYRISGDAAAQFLLLKRPVRIVTVTATHQPLINLVVKGLRESWLNVGMARVAELRL